MLNKHMTACLLASVLAAPAVAQSPALPSTDRPAATGTHSTTSGSPAMVPGGGTAAPSATAAGSSGTAAAGPSGSSSSVAGAGPAPQATSGAASGSGAPSQRQFVAQQQQGQWLASKLIGTRVVSANNETIGDVNDVLLDRSGTAQAIVIGVGGFLGIGEKDVAVPFSALEFASARDASTTASTNPGGAGTGTTTGAARNGGESERIVLRLTKADLQAAPTFQSRGGTANSAGAGGARGDRPGAASDAPAAGGGAASRP
jgi:hypothetical protein